MPSTVVGRNIDISVRTVRRKQLERGLMFRKPAFCRVLLLARRVERGPHWIYNSTEFIKRDIPARLEQAKKLELCFNCLRKGHFSDKCTLDPFSQIGDSTINSSPASSSITSTNLLVKPCTKPTQREFLYSNQVLLPTVTFLVKDVDGVTKGLPNLQNTKLAWIVSGSVPNHNSNIECHFAKVICPEDELFLKFWELNEVPQLRHLSQDKIDCENNFRQTTYRNSEGYLTVQEIEIAFSRLIRMAQNQSFPDQIEKLLQIKDLDPRDKLFPLKPILDDKRVLRVAFGPITRFFPKKDNQAHVAEIKMGHGIQRRSIRDLYLLPMPATEDDCQKVAR
ncbi:hypothetical protein ILUMI_24824 [Ignelater luminosus]|uniref:CCHC-type domain-containing protein n=1 Tax=Ignelater luminosus TaxID=2038154 RepID=A0A8K0C5L8_IGNLU|nr:hypothetical protein ILUMI_24824 [Ignelater luminosus]